MAWKFAVSKHVENSIALTMALLAAALLAGCGTSGRATTPIHVGSYGASMSTRDFERGKTELKQYTDQTRQQKESPLLIGREDGKPLAAGTPFVDLDATLVDQTGLGPHDAEGDVIDGGLLDGGVPYYWHAKNGTGDLLFSAVVRNGRVISADRFNMGRDYWAVPGKIFGRDLPDAYASGAMVSEADAAAEPDDPTDYADPNDYADNNESAFTGDANEDAWQKAYDYWCDQNGAQ